LHTLIVAELTDRRISEIISLADRIRFQSAFSSALGFGLYPAIVASGGDLQSLAHFQDLVAVSFLADEFEDHISSLEK
jgi:hypothetical protein